MNGTQGPTMQLNDEFEQWRGGASNSWDGRWSLNERVLLFYYLIEKGLPPWCKKANDDLRIMSRLLGEPIELLEIAKDALKEKGMVSINPVKDESDSADKGTPG
jgi:hypothetical protein